MPIETAFKTDREDRRVKSRFPIQRDLRYRLMQDGRTIESGSGKTVDMGSGGVAFTLDRTLAAGIFIELSISWPVELDNGTPMRLVVLGRVLRCQEGLAACTVDKYEFRTQARSSQPGGGLRGSLLPPRWADRIAKQSSKSTSPALLACVG
jgi:hypothetical protein